MPARRPAAATARTSNKRRESAAIVTLSLRHARSARPPLVTETRHGRPKRQQARDRVQAAGTPAGKRPGTSGRNASRQETGYKRPERQQARGPGTSGRNASRQEARGG